MFYAALPKGKFFRSPVPSSLFRGFLGGDFFKVLSRTLGRLSRIPYTVHRGEEGRFSALCALACYRRPNRWQNKTTPFE